VASLLAAPSRPQDLGPRSFKACPAPPLTNLASLVSDEIKLRVTDGRLKRAMDVLERKPRS